MVRMDCPDYGMLTCKKKLNILICAIFFQSYACSSTYIVTAQGFRVRPEAGRFRPFAYHFTIGTLTL